jgi:hypothetical protein
MLEHLPMSMPTREELLQGFGSVEDSEIEARRLHILKVLLEQASKMRQQLIDTGIEKVLEGRLTATCPSLRRVLALRQLSRRESRTVATAPPSASSRRSTLCACMSPRRISSSSNSARNATAMPSPVRRRA